MKRLTALTAATTVALSLVVTPNASANDVNYFTASNGVTIPVIKASEGNQGTLVFLNGDGTRRYTTPDSHFIQGIVNEVKNENVDSLFLLPPNNQDSWWRTRDVDSWCDAVREYLNTLQTPAIEVAGYSGGAEFIGRHLMLDDTTWVPDNTSFTMIGGGSIGGYSVNPPAPGKAGTKLDWVVGHNDTWLREQPTFSARHAAERSETEYKRTGFDNTTLELVSGDHYNYDFAQILGSSVREMKSSAAPAPPAPPAPAPEVPAPAPAPVPVDPGAPVPPPADKPAPAPEQKPAPAPAPEQKPAPAPEKPKPNKGSDNGDARKDEAALAWGRVWAFLSSLLVLYKGSK
ncbi:hypothetical protein [Corynebacterium sp. CCUG 70398]|uniref:hypothetical protein n=1 Tax=Corynebacterium sp. CCUG 70398 TaxID=2823891 RepID=UPI00210911F6|nr:hypothetical protein [Corynebacterium sp. CCUG 70398]MCQ4623606.1 hypothetical protein [Corynebacterium sp. CCUG 70398]